MVPAQDTLLEEVPVFPLPNFHLFPGAIAPLHIFEPRYRQMVEDLLDTAGRLVMAPVAPATTGPDRETAGERSLPSLGGLGEIVHHKKLAQGRYLIWLIGLGRVRMEEVPSERLYRKVDARVVAEEPGDPQLNDRLAPHLVDAILAHEQEGIEVSEELATGLLADILLQNLELRPDQRDRVFRELDVTRRARLALSWHRLSHDYADDDPV